MSEHPTPPTKVEASAAASLAQRSIVSISWNIVANIVMLGVGVARAVFLARLLPVETFGLYAWGGAIINLSAVPAFFGLGWAFMYRAPETEDESLAAANYLALQLLLGAGWLCLIIGYALTLAPTPLRPVLLVLGLATAADQLTQPPRLILARRVVHRRLAFFQMADVVVSSLVAVGLAWRGVALWALLATDIVHIVLILALFYVWKPVWKPRLAWAKPIIRHFLHFGGRQVLADILIRALDQLDDLWVGSFLGQTAAGFYSRAYTFATYPRRILATPVNLVAGGAYAELKEDRQRRSQAFFRFNAALVRSGFFLGGWLSLIAPEFIQIVLGDKWLPMLATFRLMLVYTLLDPLKSTVADLLIAVGKPEDVVRTRLLQLLVMVAGLFLLGGRWNIEGVALAVNLMLVVGIVSLLLKAKRHVNFSLKRLFAAPVLALISASVIGYGVSSWLASADASNLLSGGWQTGFVKTFIYFILYGGILWTIEAHELRELILVLMQVFRKQPDNEP